MEQKQRRAKSLINKWPRLEDNKLSYGRSSLVWVGLCPTDVGDVQDCEARGR